jgi:hypothetical protein
LTVDANGTGEILEHLPEEIEKFLIRPNKTNYNALSPDLMHTDKFSS